MAKELVTISPEGLEVANSYLALGSIDLVCSELNVPKARVIEILNKTEVQRYVDSVYLDTGYRNKATIGRLLDEIIANKLQEAEVSGMYTKKDLADLLVIAHKMRQDELKHQREENNTVIKNQTNVQINDSGTFGAGNYGELMRRLLSNEQE